jgi:hypothetical protein
LGSGQRTVFLKNCQNAQVGLIEIFLHELFALRPEVVKTMHILPEIGQERKAIARFHLYVDGMANVEPNLNLRAFFIRIQAAPWAVERVLQPFTVNGLVPQECSARFGPSDNLFVWLRFSGIEYGRVTSLAARLRNIPSVRGVRVSSASDSNQSLAQ